MIKFLAKLYHTCEMCNKQRNTNHYEYDLLFKSLYPKDYKTKLVICHKCAKRELGSKKLNELQ